MGEYNKPLPNIVDENRTFWEATKKEELRMQKCIDCGHIRYPIGPVCTKCLSDKFTWEKLSGKGKVFNKIVIHQVYNKAYADDVPYNVVMVKLDEGPKMFSNIVDSENDAIAIDMPVEVVFDHVTDDVAIPKFKLVNK
jgi:uncharacterized OB-fold protein